MVKPGFYKHYKGKIYRVLATGRHSESLELMIVYQGLYESVEFGSQPIFVRPYDLFVENIAHNGINQPRFQYLSEEISHPEQAKLFEQ